MSMTAERQRAETFGIQDWLIEEIRAGCRIATRHLTPADEPRRIGVSSALRAEGRTTIALGMALVQSQERGRRTILLEMDLESPSLAERVGITGAPGVAELVGGGRSLDSCIRWIAEDFGVIPAGALRRSPARVVADMQRGQLLEQIEAVCDVIVADLPPILGSEVGPYVTDLFAPLVLVVRAASTPVVQVQHAVRELPVQPTVLLNQTSSAVPSWLRRSLDDW